MFKEYRLSAAKNRGGRPPMAPGQAKRGTFATRLRPQLKARLEKAALENGRSLSEEIEVRLEESERHVEELHRAQQQSASAMRNGFLLGCQSSALAAFIGASLERIAGGLASDPRAGSALGSGPRIRSAGSRKSGARRGRKDKGAGRPWQDRGCGQCR